MHKSVALSTNKNFNNLKINKLQSFEILMCICVILEHNITVRLRKQRFVGCINAFCLEGKMNYGISNFRSFGALNGMS